MSQTQNSAPPATNTSKTKKGDDKGKKASSVSKRLRKELGSIMFANDKTMSAFPLNGNILSWQGTIVGPKGTVYSGLKYTLSLDFPSDYPCSAPTVKFKTPCYHPNVDQHGNICLDILNTAWSAVYDVSAVLRSIQSLLGEPNNASPLNGHAASLWDSQVEYKEHLHNHYKQNAKNDKP